MEKNGEIKNIRNTQEQRSLCGSFNQFIVKGMSKIAAIKTKHTNIQCSSIVMASERTTWTWNDNKSLAFNSTFCRLIYFMSSFKRFIDPDIVLDSVLELWKQQHFN